MTERSLYECLHALVIGDRVCCRHGRRLLPQSTDGSLTVSLLATGEPLVYAICQECTDFDYLGPPVPEGERGWMNHAEQMPGESSKKYKKIPSTEPHSASRRPT